MEPPSLMLRTLFLLGLFNFVANQDCNEGSYSVINNPQRSALAQYDSANIPLCDYGISEETWFRFSSYSGDAIVEREDNDPVPIYRCSTEVPIYILGNGSHPVTDYATTDATVCSNNNVDSCAWTSTIQIHRCPVQGDPSYFYLYKLKSPTGCSLSYCVGDKAVCDVGFYWDGFSCIDYLPLMESPIFAGPKINGSENPSAFIYFTCEVQYVRQPNDSNARFRVTFLFDGQPLEYVGVDANPPPERLQSTILNPNSDYVVVLSELHLRGRLGREISCQAESYWEGNGDATAKMTSSANHYAAFESTVDVYIISPTTGPNFNVPFRSTLPFTCHHCVNVPEEDLDSCCYYRFRMEKSTAASPQCFIMWRGEDTVTTPVYFIPTSTQIADSYALVFIPYNDDEGLYDGRSLWHDYLVPTVKMNYLPEPTTYKSCQSNTDPHLVTFDGVSLDNLMEGDFYLVKATTEANQIMEIQVRHEKCWTSAACSCGIVVREGNSAYKINICEGGPWNPDVQRNPTVVQLLSQHPADFSTINVDDTGLKFSIRMPSGLRVEADATKPYLNLYVHLPIEYHDKTDSASMCGNSNCHKGDDSTTNLEEFRIPYNLSYFNRQPECSSIYNGAATKCGCNTTYTVCSNTDPALEYQSPAVYSFTGKSTSGVVCNQANVSGISASLYDASDPGNDFILEDDILFPPYTYDPNFGVNVSFTWPTPKLKTEEEVTQYCTEQLTQSSPAYDDCSANVNTATIIAMCVSDIQILDDWVSMGAYAFYFEQTCLNNLAATVNSSNATDDVLKPVSGKLCPNQCTGRGSCSEGTCTCNTGFIGADCSIDQSLPPSLTGIIRKGLCDVRQRPCDVISVYGSGVPFSSALKCRYADQSTGDQRETSGTFITAGEYSCPVPETTTHRRRKSATTRTTALSTKKVSITIDGVLYSNALDFVIFDSVCMECNNTATCRQKENSCLISDQCFADKAFNPGDSCLQCVPTVSRISWTDIKVAEDWSTCTRDCDTGVIARNVTCDTTMKLETEFCKQLDCPGNAEEKSQGFGITLSSEDLKQILLDHVGSLVPFSDALNQYCSKNASVCCKSIGMETLASSVKYTSPDLLTYASGYPVINTNDTSLKIIVKIDRAKLVAECSQTPAEETNIVYGAANLLYDAITTEKSEIEEDLSVTILSVWSPSSSSSANLRTDIVYNLIGCWMFVVLVWNGFE